jgi:hypothetical protein
MLATSGSCGDRRQPAYCRGSISAGKPLVAASSSRGRPKQVMRNGSSSAPKRARTLSAERRPSMRAAHSSQLAQELPDPPSPLSSGPARLS